MTTLKVVHANVLADRYDYKRTWPQRRPAFIAAVRKARPGLVSLTECQAPAAQALAAATGLRAISFRGSSILFDPARLVLRRRLMEERWLAGSQTHSLLLVEFQLAQPGGAVFNFGVSHLPPFATRAALRRKQMGLVSAKTKGWKDPTILCTDANWSKTFEPFVIAAGWVSARMAALDRRHADYRTSGSKWSEGNPIDYVLTRRVRRHRLYDVIDGRSWSDHNALISVIEL